MNQSPRQAGSSPRQGAYAHNIPALNRHSVPLANADGQNSFSDDAIGMPQGSGALHDSFDSHDGAANDFSQSPIPKYGFSTQRNNMNNRPPSESDPSFATQSSQGLLRGTANYAVASSPCALNNEISVANACSPPSHFLPQGQSTFGSATSHQTHSSPQLPLSLDTPSYAPNMQRQTKYQPFQNLFYTAQQARDHRRRETLFGRMPYLQVDNTIEDVEKNRTLHVEEIFNAMTSGEVARDNNGSIAMKRWVGNAHYPGNLVEAYAHKVFDCLLQQAREGFRGWEHNDYVADERKGDDIDREVDCAGRLANIIQALEQEKTICEDVMNSACQIRMFVNAPRAYANRKHQNRVGNSKRGKGKDATDANPRPIKAPRITGRRTRARSSAAPEMSTSRDSTPQYQPATQRAHNSGPYFNSPHSQSLALSPASASYTASRLAPLHRPTMSASRPSFTQHAASANSAPTSSPQTAYSPQPFIPRMASEASFASPLVAHASYSPTITAGDVKPPSTHDWREMVEFDAGTGESFAQHEATIDPHISQWGFAEHTSGDGRSANLFEREHGGYVTLAHIEYASPDCVAADPFFPYWNEESGMQQMPPNKGQSEHQNRA
ncbi:hypothetical protein HBI16_186040 [Parastagonospora nodorum]|nr:hypothetical protein HBI16_186040 [Parastagonospora nodorum]